MTESSANAAADAHGPDSPADPTAAPPPALKPKRRALKIVVVTATLVAAIILCIPYLASAGFVRSRIESGMTEALGVPVTIDDYGLDWFTGFEMRGMRIGNPDGFGTATELLELRAVHGDIGLLGAVRGSFDVEGVVDGMVVRIYQRADGTTNLQALGGGGGGDPGPPREPGDPVDPDPRGTDPAGGGGSNGDLDDVLALLRDLDPVRLDLELRESTIEIVHEERGELERLENLNVRISKEFGRTSLRLDIAADLHRVDRPDHPGRMDIRFDAHPDAENPLDVDLRLVAVDLERYRPIVDQLLGQGALDAVEGTLSGNARARMDRDQRLVVDGELGVDRPHFAGELLQGLNVQAPKWTVRPNVALRLGDDGLPTELDVSSFLVDLGFVALRGLDAATTAKLTGDGTPAFGLDLNLDLGAIGEFGGIVPAELRGSGAKLVTRVGLPLAALASAAGDDPLVAAKQARLTGNLRFDRIDAAGYAIEGFKTVASIKDGRLWLNLDDGAKLNGGPLALTVKADFADTKRLPLQLKLGVDDARVGAEAVQLLQYAVPLLAGLDENANLDFESDLGLQLQLDGPALRTDGEGWLEWLNHWTGGGQLGLAKTSFTPAAAFGELLAFGGGTAFGGGGGVPSAAGAGGGKKLTLDTLSTKFKLADGFVETALMKLSTKGRDYGFRGRTSLAGDLEWTFDAKELLAGHRDGKKVLDFLGDTELGAGLGGTLSAPALALPDVGKLFQQAATNALQQEAGDRIQKELNRGLDRIFKRGKK